MGKHKKWNMTAEAATQADIADEEQGEEPTEGVIMTAPIPEPVPPKETKRPASPKRRAAKSLPTAK